MDPNLVYQKTDSGEEAMRQRTKVVQRNQRMVLILVDGKSSVADLCDKTGNPQMTVGALRDLEKDGFVVPVSAIESAWMWEQSRKIAQEIKAQVSSLSSRKKDEPSAEAPADLSEYPVLHSVFDEAKPTAQSAISVFSVAPAGPLPGATLGGFSALGTEKQVREKMKWRQPADDDADKKETVGKRRKMQFRKTKEDEDVQIKPIRRGHRSSGLGWPMRALLALLLLGVSAVLGVLFFPYGRYLPDAETALSQALGQDVKIGGMTVGFYPKPGLLLSDVRLGGGGAKGGLHLADVRVLPLPDSIFSPRIVFRDVELSGLRLSPESLLALPVMLASVADPASPFSVQRVTLEKVDLSLRGLGFSGLGGRLELDRSGLLQSFSLQTADRTLHLEGKPLGAAFEIALEGYAWRLSEGSPLLFDSLKIKGVLEPEAFRAASVDMRIFDGSIQGSALFEADRRVGVSGKLLFERVNVRKLGEALGLGQQLEGEASGGVEFSALAEAWGGIWPAMLANGDFSVRRGSVNGLDLMEAVRRASGSPVRGGITRFEQLNGVFRLAPDSIRLSNLALTSGLLHSSGAVAIGKNLQLNGTMSVLMRGSANQIYMPVSIGGTLKTPEVQSGVR